MYSLCTQDAAARELARRIGASRTFALEVNEDKCFESNQWLSLGTIHLISPVRNDFESETEVNERAIQCGHFTWQLPDQVTLNSGLRQALGDAYDDRAQKTIAEALQDITRRLCLLFPTFDPTVICKLPLRRPATIVTDTSSVMQGALDFVARFLYPMARIKVPTIVSVETTNMADNFLSLRHSTKLKDKRSLCFQQHVKSQGTQRVLMRTQLHSDIEVENPLQENDPWRVIFTEEVDEQGRKTGLTTVHRSLFDRLILDSARQHLVRLTPGHNLFVMTSDQGMARMALAEGLTPIFVEARKTSNPLGRILTGTLFHPFNSQLVTVSLTSLLWEVASCFGATRLRHKDGSEPIRVVAMSEDVIWFPYQSKEDLLWCRFNASLKTDLQATQLQETTPTKEVTAKKQPTPQTGEIITTQDKVTHPQKTRTSTWTPRKGAYKINLARMFNLIRQLVSMSSLTKEQALEALGVTSEEVYDQYKLFLLAGDFISKTDDGIQTGERLVLLCKALQDVDIPRLREMFGEIPSFRAFLEFIENEGRHPDWVKHSSTERRGATGAYRSLAEITASALAIPDRGICLTSNVPEPQAFTDQALEVYSTLANTRDEVLTGEWLEELAWAQGIHPVLARVRLNEAFHEGLMNRSFEGSTPDPRFESHTLDVLENPDGEPSIRRYHLYHGNFMLTDRASVRIKLERITK